MKTLVVLCALASVALAAPTLQDEGLVDTHHVPDWHIQVHPSIPETVKREKKSTTELSSGTVLHTGASNIDIHNDASPTFFMGRTIAPKKPLIVKKKYGYRLYRDSEEEKAHADSHESCGRQVKVKLCDEDGKFREMLRNSGHGFSEVQTPDDDMKLSIRMAKEAVENLQRDLMKLEHKNTAMKMAHDSESDADLHEDIEVARQALEHIHKNFGDLDTMSLHATATRDSEALHDLHITVAKSEEEKMAQWKEAMENIQKNVEIARNIEDSFKSANQESLLHLDQSASAPTINTHTEDITSHDLLSHEHQRAAGTHLQTTEKEHSEHGLTQKVTNEHMTNNHAREDHHFEDDMNPAASDAIEMKTVDIENHHILRSENHEHHEEMKNAEVKLEEHEAIMPNIELHASTPIDSSSLMRTEPMFMKKETEEHTEIKADDKNVMFKTSENKADDHITSSSDSIKTLTSDKITEHQRNTEEESVHAITSDETEHLSDLHAKSVKHVEDDQKEKEHSIHKEISLNMEVGKSAEILKPELENPHTEIINNKVKEADLHIETNQKEKEDNLNKSIQEIHLHKLNNVAEQIENSMRATEQEQQKHHKIDYNDTETEHLIPSHEMKSVEDHLHHHLPSMKSAEHLVHHHLASMKAAENHLHHVAVPTNEHWVHGHKHLASNEATEEWKKDFNGIDHMRYSQPEHHYVPNKMDVTHNYETGQHSQQYGHATGYHHHKMHEMSGMADGHLSKFHTNMRDAMDGLGSEHMYRWAPTHEYRNAYGGGLSGSIGSSGGGGAVGVFPNANTGGCGIPLLLSCSPSVVSGSLAKAHPSSFTGSGQGSYTGSSYRSEDDFAFHNKRDIKKTNEIRGTSMLRTPTIVKQKTGTMLENKL